jgi:hypothetical protein
VIESKTCGQGSLQGRREVGADAIVLEQRHRGETGQPDAGRATVAGGLLHLHDVARGHRGSSFRV